MKTLRSPQQIALIEELRRVRKESGLTQAALAARLGVAQSFVAKVEGQERRLDVVEFVRWMVACGAAEDCCAVLDRLKVVEVATHDKNGILS